MTPLPPDDAMSSPCRARHLAHALDEHGPLAVMPKPRQSLVRSRGSTGEPAAFGRAIRPSTAGTNESQASDHGNKGGASPWRTARGLAALAIAALAMAFICPVAAQPVSSDRAKAAAVHPVADVPAMRHWLGRVPVTRDFPPDVATTLRAQSPLYVIEMTTAPGCVPCADLWARLHQVGMRHGWRVRTISGHDALLRSGRLGLPWVGHPVAWVRPHADPGRMIPIAIGTDHAPNLTRNLYLAAKMLTGVRPAVAVRAMSKFTGIVGMPAPAVRRR